MVVDELTEVRSLEAGDGSSLAYRYFPTPPGVQRASIIYLHGVQSHSGWYVEAGAELARNGYAVYMPDRRGSGLSSGPRGFIKSREQLLDDLSRFVALARRDHPGLPMFLMGNCWGAKPAVAFALRRQDELAGLVLLCPGVITRVGVPLRDVLKAAVGRVAAPHWQVRLPLTPDMYTAHPKYLQFIREDCLALREVTAHFCVESFLWDRMLPKHHGLRLPVLVMQAGQDPIVDIEATRAWLGRLSSQDKTYRDYPDFRHTLDFDDHRQEVWDDLAAWLDERTARAGAGGAVAVPTDARA